MSKVLVTESSLIGIATAIRTKNGTQNSYKPGQMAAAIEALPDPSVLVSKSITQNGSYDPEDDSADGYSAVTVNVPNSYAAGDEGKVVSGGALVAQTARSSEITENGTYNTTTNNSVTVNVSGGGGVETFGKLKVGTTNPIVGGAEYGPITSASTDYIVPMLDDGTPAKLDLSQPFEICCRFKIGTAPGTTGRNIWGSSNSYYYCPSIAVYTDKIVYYVTTNGSGWNYNGVSITPSGYTVPLNTYITARLTWDGTDFTFYVNDGTNEYTATLEGVTPYYNSNYSFEFGGQNKSQYSIAAVNATIDLSQTYLKQGNTVIWGGGAA